VAALNRENSFSTIVRRVFKREKTVSSVTELVNGAVRAGEYRKDLS